MKYGVGKKRNERPERSAKAWKRPGRNGLGMSRDQTLRGSANEHRMPGWPREWPERRGVSI